MAVDLSSAERPSDRAESPLRSWRTRTVVNILLVCLGPVLAALTVFAIGRFSGRVSPQGLLLVFLADFAYFAVVATLVARRIIRLMVARRHAVGSKLHLRLSGVLAGIALVPTVLVAIIAAVTLNVGVESWFSERVGDVVGSSLAAAQAYEKQEHDHLVEDARFLAEYMDQSIARRYGAIERGLQEILSDGQAQIQRGLKEAYLINSASELKARGDRSYLFDFEAPDENEIRRATEGETVVIKDWANNEFRALIMLPRPLNTYLYVSRVVDGNLLILLDETTETAKLYNRLESERGRILFELGLVYVGFTVLVIIGAIWAGLWIAERLAQPVSRLTTAVQQVASGDLDVSVPEERGGDEIAVLGRFFNTMTDRLKHQRDDLIAANDRTERRRRLFDSVLSGVTAGVIGLDAQGRIEVMNAAAATLLDQEPDSFLGKELTSVVPEFSDLFQNLRRRHGQVSEGEVRLTGPRKAEILLVRIASRTREGRHLEGYVVTFDNVTELVTAQRMAAWGEIAQRMAHEVKNPLTPIRLLSQRLKQKFSSRVGEDAHLLDQHFDVIIRQTNSLLRIVDEFSQFARMPEPEFQVHDIGILINDTVALERAALPISEVEFKCISPSNPFMAEVDPTMISRALINLIKNAGEAIAALEKSEGPADFVPEIRIGAERRGDEIEITVADNGIGFPEGLRSRLFEPYVTHREGGTGLGLWIVRKIAHQHGGGLELEDAPVFEGNAHCGVLARFILPEKRPTGITGRGGYDGEVMTET